MEDIIRDVLIGTNQQRYANRHKLARWGHEDCDTREHKLLSRGHQGWMQECIIFTKDYDGPDTGGYQRGLEYLINQVKGHGEVQRIVESKCKQTCKINQVASHVLSTKMGL